MVNCLGLFTKPSIMLHLIKDRFSSVHEIEKWLDQLEIPSEFSSY